VNAIIQESTLATLATVATHEEETAQNNPTDPDLINKTIEALPTPEERNTARALQSAMQTIEPQDAIGQSTSTGEKIIGYGLSHEYKQAQGIGALLAMDWDGKTGGNSLSHYMGADLEHPNPIKIASIYGLAQSKGWVMPPDEWQDPESITAHYEAEDYPLEQLPDPLRLAVIAVTNYLQCPLAMVANSLLGALALSIQGLVNVARDSQLVSVSSLFLLLIGESGERKSACDKMLTQHLNELDIERFKADSEERKEYAKALKIWQAKLTGAENALKRDSEKGLPTQEIEQRINALYLEEPLAPRGTNFLLEDATPEGLIKLMDKGHPTSGLFSSEAGIVFGSHGMASDSAMRNMATLNKFWDGDAIRVTRSDTNKNVLLTGRRLTLSLAVQASTVRTFFDGSKGLARGTGFGARFLIAWPKSTQGFRPYKEPANSFSALDTFKRKTLELINTDLVIDEKTGAIEAHTLTLSAKAKAVWITFYNDTEAELKTGGELTDIKDVTSKAGDNAARIAALFHVYEYGVTGTISEDHMTKACHLMAWYLMESRRFFGEIALPKELSNATLLDTWLIDYCKDNQLTRISTMLARQLCPNSIRSKAVYEETIKNLTELKRIRTTKEGKKKWIEVNPKLLEA
jgi:putative DNA primase/helicase